MSFIINPLFNSNKIPSLVNGVILLLKESKNEENKTLRESIIKDLEKGLDPYLCLSCDKNKQIVEYTHMCSNCYKYFCEECLNKFKKCGPCERKLCSFCLVKDMCFTCQNRIMYT